MKLSNLFSRINALLQDINFKRSHVKYPLVVADRAFFFSNFLFACFF